MFAKWVPEFEEIAHDFITDANGFELVSHEVFRNGSAPFAASFVPVDASITMRDFAEASSFTVWNDRPQAGSVHYDKSIKLLLQRALRTNDHGGIPTKLYED